MTDRDNLRNPYDDFEPVPDPEPEVPENPTLLYVILIVSFVATISGTVVALGGGV